MSLEQKDAYDCLISMASDVRSGRYGNETEDFAQDAFEQDLIETFELET